MNNEYDGIIMLGQNIELAGRGIAGPRLRTVAKQNGYDILVIDCLYDLTYEQCIEILENNISEKTKFIGLSTSWAITGVKSFFWYQKEFFENIKKKWPQLLIITGGHDEFSKEFLLKNSDYHFHGFSDNSFVEFLNFINHKPNNLKYVRSPFGKGFIINSNLDFPISDPNQIETVFIKEDNFQPHQPVPIEISRGCIFRCSFCRHPFQGKKDYDSYQRTPESIASELKRNYELFKTTRYAILDDTFNDSIEKINRVAAAIKLSGIPKFEFVAYIKAEMLVTKPEMIELLANIGLRGAFIGFETFNNSARSLIGKGTKIEKVFDACRKLATINNGQVLIHGAFIIGLNNDTKESIEDTFNFLKSKENDFIQSWIFEGLLVRQYSYNSLDVPSIFDKNPEKLGFKFDNRGHWYRDDGWNFHSAQMLSTRLNNESMDFVKPGGWRVAGCWHVNIPDNEIKNIRYFSLRGLLKYQAQKRAYEEYLRLTKK